MIIVLGIIGAGGNTKFKHILFLGNIQGVVIKVICNRTLPSAQKFCDEFQITDTYDNHQDLMDDPNIYKELTIAAFDAGKHTLC